MATEVFDEQYFVYENRLASFHGPQPVANRRASNASSRAPKALSWPHKKPAAVDLANAGFFFNPQPSSPDNVRCFLCHKDLDGWEEDDDPLMEHLKHSSGCGWAICAAIEAELGDTATEDPRQSHLLEARKATFAGLWPYESKKGWKCKTKQLAEAGWKYTPTLESDDETTCVYCQLALGGWEPSDKPMDEHRRRAPDCPFFTLISQNPAPKKTGRGKAARGSKVSRMSTQSIATATSDVLSVSDLAADHEDSILTTTSVMTQGGRKAKGKKAAAAGKSRKTRAKKDEAVEVHEDADIQDVESLPAPPPKISRGKKRGSDALEDPLAADVEAPPPKKRATRGARASNMADSSVLPASEHDVEMSEAPAVPAKAPVGRKRGRASTTTRTTRKASAASIASTASAASLRAQVPDDDELDRQLQADLERQAADDKDMSEDSETEGRSAAPRPPPRTKGKRVISRKVTVPKEEVKDDYAMFDPAPVEPDEAAVEAELQSLQKEMEVPGSPAEQIQVPKKGRKPGPRKASKQVKKGKEAKPEPEPEPEPLPVAEAQPEPLSQPVEEAEPEEQHDLSIASTGTVVKGPTEPSGPPKRGRGRPKKSAESQQGSEKLAELPTKAVDQPAAADVEVEIESATMTESFSTGKRSPGKVVAKSPSPPPKKTANAPRVEKALPPPPRAEPQRQNLPVPPATPRANHISATPSAKQATLSPSQSPQSSDAENQPPSSKPATSASTKRVVLAPVQTVSTPMRTGSLSKRGNVIGGLQSAVPWTAVDLELVFGGDKENGDSTDGLLKKGSDLTTPEKNMTVEEWVYYNAGQAEQRLKHECESMVSAFERQGTRAMRVLEELVVD